MIAHRRPHQAPVQHPSEAEAAEDRSRPGLRSAWRCASSPSRSRTATPRSASSTRRGRRCRAASRTSSRCRGRTATSRCTPRWSASAASRSRCRSAPRRCTSIAEEGIAAHWKYKEGRVGADRDEQHFLWLRQLLEWQQEVRDPQEFLQNLKIDLYPEEVYIFTPEGGGEGAAARRDADRLRLRHSHRRRPPVRRRPRQRQDGAAAHAPAQRRHRRDRHARRAQAEPRLADHRRHVARAQQDQALHPRRGEGQERRARTQAVREGSAPLRAQPEDAGARATASPRRRPSSA